MRLLVLGFALIGSSAATGTGDTAAAPPSDPRPAPSATRAAREEGGVGCDTAGTSAWAGLLVGLGALALCRASSPLCRGVSWGLVLAAALTASSTAHAGPPPADEGDAPEVHVLVRGMVERWNDPAIGSVYRSGTWLAGAGVVVDLVGPLGVDVEVGFGRLKGDTATLEVAPLSALVALTAPIGRADLFVAAGPAWTVFTETGARSIVDGARIAGEVRGGVRADTGLIDPPAPPAPSTFDRMELELYVARRAELPGSGPGLRLGAWRAAVGLGVVF